jgi:hypothetical protein
MASVEPPESSGHTFWACCGSDRHFPSCLPVYLSMIPTISQLLDGEDTWVTADESSTS